MERLQGGKCVAVERQFIRDMSPRILLRKRGFNAGKLARKFTPPSLEARGIGIFALMAAFRRSDMMIGCAVSRDRVAMTLR